MGYATKASILHERPQVKASILHERPQVDDDFQKSNIDYENLIIEDGKSAVKGMVFGVIFSIPIWILIISFIIWVTP